MRRLEDYEWFFSSVSNVPLINQYVSQLNVISSFWKECFRNLKWKVKFCSEECFENSNFEYLYEVSKREIVINIQRVDNKNIIYRIFGFFIYNVYVRFDFFDEFCKSEHYDIKSFMYLQRMEYYDELDVFLEMFVDIIENNNNAVLFKDTKYYNYVKDWITNDIYKLNVLEIPKNIEVGAFVTNNQMFVLEKAFKSLPQKLQKVFEKYSWKILIQNKYYLDYWVLGYIDYSINKIVIYNISKDMRITFFHEIGHYIDFLEKGISQEKDFIKVFENEKNQLSKIYNEDEYSEYLISSSEEFFAVSISLFFYREIDLKLNLPKTYRIIKKIVEKWY